jgi:probable phosphoglycerate mutase
LSAADAATRIVAVRHGQTAWNVAARIQGHLDEPLDAVGRAQARRLAAALADEGLAAVYSSDLARAHATAQALAAPLALPVWRDARLRERHFGRFEGLSHAEIEARWPDDALRWRRRDPQFEPGGGESLVAFSARCVAAAAELAARHPGQTIALVAHGGVLDCLYRAATGLALDAPRSWALGNATVNRLLWHGQGFTLVGWNDDAHLAGVAHEAAGDEPDAAPAPRP